MRGRQRLAIITLMLLVGAVAVAGTAGAVQAQGRTLSTTLTGAAEVPGPGDPNGSGTATLTVNPGLGQICYELTVSGIAPATAAHIHVGAVGVAGPVVVPLDPPTDGTSSGCAEVSRELALAILMSPSDYYVNVHNAEFPAGAVRGQLSK
jgi:CHRD domain